MSFFSTFAETIARIYMERVIFNDVQMHILQMFSYSPSPQEVDDLKNVLAQYYAERVQKEADALYEEGILGEEAIENILKEHLRYSPQK